MTLPIQVERSFGRRADDLLGENGRPIDEIVVVATDAFAPSPFQPSGRPSEAALSTVRALIEELGSAVRLGEPDAVARRASFDPEVREFADFVADVAVHGVESPVEARRTDNGFELIAGHRRLAAARLAGLSHVRTRDLGVVPDHEAAALVFRRNRLRSEFTPWQEARALRLLRDRRRAAGLDDQSVRELAQAMGYSVGRASELLAMTRAFPGELLERLGDGNRRAGEEALSRLPYRTLRDLLKITEPERRLAATRRAINGDAAGAARAPGGWRLDGRRDGSFSIVVAKPLADLTPAERHDLSNVLEGLVVELRRMNAGGSER